MSMRPRSNAPFYSVANSGTNNDSDLFGEVTASECRRARCGGGCNSNNNWCWCCCRGRTRYGRSLDEYRGGNGGGSANASSATRAAASCYQGLFCGCYVKEESRPGWLTYLLYSRYATKLAFVWRVFIFLFSVFLLFGPAVQNLADVDPTGDQIFFWLRIVMLFFFTLDIAVRCVLEEHYFVLALCSSTGGNELYNSTSTAPHTPSRNTTAPSSGAAANGADSKRPMVSIGSFVFWCDLISTMTILYDLSIINESRFAMGEHFITVIDGIPSDGTFTTDRFSRLALNTLEANVIVLILRTFRCARFVQSRSAVAVSNKIHWYGKYKLLKWLNPCFYYNLWQIIKRREQPHTHPHTPPQDLGSVATDVLAAARAEAEGDARGGGRQRKQRRRGPGSIWEKMKSTLLLGVESDEKLAEKHEAAIKIQRAWRNRVRCEFDDDDHWIDPTTSSGADFSSNNNNSNNKLSTAFSNRPDGGNLPDQEKTFRKKLPTSLGSYIESNNFSAKSSGFITATPKSRFESEVGKGRHGESQVGSDMRELTGKRVTVGTLLILLCTVLCTYTTHSNSQMKTMVVLHSQTKTLAYKKPSLEAAVTSSVPTLYMYRAADGLDVSFPNLKYHNSTELMKRNIIKITVTDSPTVDGNGTSIGWFDGSHSVKQEAIVDIVATLFIILFWVAGVISFSGPVMLLVITPVEQMVHLLGMLTVDLLGYQSTARYKKFLRDDDELSKNTIWSKEVLKGMETSFLKSTILRIGSLMKIGFGSAGVQIIQNNLKKGHSKNMLVLNSQGTTVSCIFLFSDIRQFTDATEQLQEEVFVFTNRIAAVVHSICNSYGGAANKNIGDAFLLSWSLDEKCDNGGDRPLKAKSNQADKALLSVIKICMALTYDNFFLEPLSDAARGRLKTKLKDRTGSVVQMGFGLHAGKAVQGAIGSQRKIDATYVAESVERAEFLESSTKKYGLKVMMSGKFHQLLHSRTQYRCRKIDRILLLNNDDEYYEESDRQGEFMDLFTFDMDVDAMQRANLTRNNFYNNMKNGENDNLLNAAGSFMEAKTKMQAMRNRRKGYSARSSLSGPRDLFGGNSDQKIKQNDSNHLQPHHIQPSLESFQNNANGNSNNIVEETPELVLPTGPALYSQNVWLSPDMRKIRDKYIQSFFFFQKYKLGLDAFYNKEWDDAKKCFQDILEHFDDGPSIYFLGQIEQNNGVPPKGFKGYGIAD